jgi:hypothetical protein
MQAIAGIEKRLPALEARLGEIDRELADPQAWEAPERMAALGRERALLVAEREDLETRWLDLAEQRERIEADEA